jgi:serine/threonine protein kinase
MSCEILKTGKLSGLPPGSIVAGKYRIDEVLAEGGMGIIYRGWHLVLDQPVAVKVMRPELADRPEASLRFLNEARAAARLRGTNVARVLDSGAIASGNNELLYIVLEYLEGADLRTVLEQKGALSVECAVDFILQACEGLAEAHAVGIVHRDVKPENLFLTRQPDGSEIIKLLDFGISKRTDGDPLLEACDNQSLGSPHYMAPEQMSAPHAVDMRADIWSLGIVAYELLTLRVPFDGETVATLCAQVLGRDPASLRVYLPELPAAVDEAVLGCLVKDRAGRHANVRELAVRLAPFGSSKAEESLRRIQRIFDRQAGIPVLIDVDVDLSELTNDNRAPRFPTPPAPPVEVREASGSFDDEALETQPRRRRNVGRVGLAAAAAAAALAFAVPGQTTIDAVRAKTWQVLSPIGERARVVAEHPSIQLSQLFPRTQVEESAIATTREPEVAKAPRSDESVAPVKASATVASTAPRPVVFRPARWRAEPAPAGLWAPPPESGPAPAPSTTAEERPVDDEVPDQLLPPYEQNERPSGLRNGNRGGADVASSRYGLDDRQVARAEVGRDVPASP